MKAQGIFITECIYQQISVNYLELKPVKIVKAFFINLNIYKLIVFSV